MQLEQSALSASNSPSAAHAISYAAPTSTGGAREDGMLAPANAPAVHPAVAGSTACHVQPVIYGAGVPLQSSAAVARSAPLPATQVGSMGRNFLQPVDQGSLPAVPASQINCSINTRISPTRLVDPGLGPRIYASISEGRPVGVIHDLEFFWSLLRINPGMKYRLYSSFIEAATNYSTQFEQGHVHLSDSFLSVPLPLPGPASGAVADPTVAPTLATASRTSGVTEARPHNHHLARRTVAGPRSIPDGQTSAPSPSGPVANPRTTATPAPAKVKEVIEVPSGSDSDQDASYSSEDEEDPVALGPNPGDIVEVIDDVDDHRLARISKYPSPSVSAARVTATSRAVAQGLSRTAVSRAASQGPAVAPLGKLRINRHGDLEIQPPNTTLPLTSTADPTRTLPSHPDLVPNPFTSHPTRSAYAVTHTIPAQGPPTASKKRADRPFDQARSASAAPSADSNDDAAAKKRRLGVVETAFASLAAAAGGSAATPGRDEMGSLFAGAPVASGSSLGSPLHLPDQPAWTHAELDEAGAVLGHTPTVAPKKKKTRGRPRKADRA